jgi:hypothetical protein
LLRYIYLKERREELASKKTLWPLVILLLVGVFFAGTAMGKSTDMHKVAQKNGRGTKGK